MNDIVEIAMILAMASVTFFCGYGLALSGSIPKDEIIRLGYAHYIVDPKTGATTFEWIRIPEPEASL